MINSSQVISIEAISDNFHEQIEQMIESNKYSLYDKLEAKDEKNKCSNEFLFQFVVEQYKIKQQEVQNLCKLVLRTHYLIVDYVKEKQKQIIDLQMGLQELKKGLCQKDFFSKQCLRKIQQLQQKINEMNETIDMLNENKKENEIQSMMIKIDINPQQLLMKQEQFDDKIRIKFEQQINQLRKQLWICEVVIDQKNRVLYKKQEQIQQLRILYQSNKDKYEQLMNIHNEVQLQLKNIKSNMQYSQSTKQYFNYKQTQTTQIQQSQQSQFYQNTISNSQISILSKNINTLSSQIQDFQTTNQNPFLNFTKLKNKQLKNNNNKHWIVNLFNIITQHTVHKRIKKSFPKIF